MAKLLLALRMMVLILQRLFLEALFDVFYFPVWWYTRGAWHAAGWCFGLLKEGNTRLAPGLWAQTIFVPMFGQYDFVGRLISFMMRLGNLIIRGALLVLWLGACASLFAAWLAIPVVVSYGLARSLMPIKN